MPEARECVRYEKHGHVARVTLDRPQVLNAMNLRMHAELAEIWDDFESDDDIWVGVLSGAGERSFSVGQDLKELVRRVEEGTATSTFGSRGQPGWPRLTERFSMSKPLIARVNGYALGGGFELALACDIVIAAEHAEFALTEARLGLVAGAGGVFRLTRQAPFRIAMGHLLTGRRMTAARAYELGLVNEVVPAGELDACVEGWLEDVLSCAPLSLRAAKEAATVSATLPLDRAFATRYVWEERRMLSRDALEGPRAFVEKRLPKWTGT
ncbi:enoyl-CoA hydratase-related protein [Streptomyces phaeoluteigriseus]|uniref:Enoyl-CoA hydratase-related protein n=1 Tax=Streptomyces phaeoluteigriseus TaxID=114686 RepID=A0ABY4Z9J8_9ACTN|nr:enoyl-CoA-hydratase DpgD [Streptomyces phaeoluteigriseus]USQ85717.1 enoyl-CoA hydratase-related protein [Streptomyces phaeoluteigriseus]